MFEELSLHILDIAMNSLAAGARTVWVDVLESQHHDWLILRVKDDGRGMDAATLQRVLQQTFTTKPSRKKPIGLGLALLRQTSEMCGGTFHVQSLPDKGTSVTASMRLSHVDRPPLGKLQDTLLALSANDPNVDVRLRYRTDTEMFQFSSQEGRNHEPRRTQKTQRENSTANRAA
jgi:anti-sigma regulatory factor (Ser/Thr protein kinase)